jgi:hypothetical protein
MESNPKVHMVAAIKARCGKREMALKTIFEGKVSYEAG